MLKRPLLSILVIAMVGPLAAENQEMEPQACAPHYERIMWLAEETFGPKSRQEVKQMELTEPDGCAVYAEFEDQGLLIFVAEHHDRKGAEISWRELLAEYQKKMRKEQSTDGGKQVSLKVDNKEFLMRAFSPGLVDKGGYIGNMKCRWVNLTVACAASFTVQGSRMEIRADSAEYWPFPKWLQYIDQLK
ncbi:MAG: hypothetical protein CMF59_05695 [Leptospiraceae bacterium]|nr:hypothetical protein [Leptospiraceae bacterium]